MWCRAGGVGERHVSFLPALVSTKPSSSWLTLSLLSGCVCSPFSDAGKGTQRPRYHMERGLGNLSKAQRAHLSRTQTKSLCRVSAINLFLLYSRVWFGPAGHSDKDFISQMESINVYKTHRACYQKHISKISMKSWLRIP